MLHSVFPQSQWHIRASLCQEILLILGFFGGKGKGIVSAVSLGAVADVQLD